MEHAGLQDYLATLRRLGGRAENIAISLNPPGHQSLLCHLKGSGESVRRTNHLRKYLKALIQEAKLLRCPLGACRLGGLHWPLAMTALLQPAEITEITYHLHRLFPRAQDVGGRYILELDAACESEGLIALAEGLGMNEILLSVADDSKDLEPFINHIRRYDFRTLGVQLRCGILRHPARAEALVHRLIALELDSFVLNCPAVGDPLRLMLVASGYRRSGAHGYLSPRVPDQVPLSNVLGIGPGALTVLSGFQSINVERLDQYCQKLDQGQLPFKCGGVISL